MSPQRNLSAVTTLLAVTSLVVGAIDENRFPLNRIITKDVAILGGGASGAHAAVRLREDFGKSTIVIEKQEDLVCQFRCDLLYWASIFIAITC